MTTKTMRNWNVGVLFGKEERRRHFHQLFRHLRFEENRTLNSTHRQRHDGHFDILLGNRRQPQATNCGENSALPHVVPPSAALGRREPARAQSRRHSAAQHAPAARDPSGLLAASPVEEPSVVVTLCACPAPPPLWPWPSPGAVRYGADSRPGPSRLPSVHAATWNGGVALSSGGHFMCRRLHRHVQGYQKSNTNLFEPWWWWWWLCGSGGGGGADTDSVFDDTSLEFRH